MVLTVLQEIMTETVFWGWLVTEACGRYSEGQSEVNSEVNSRSIRVLNSVERVLNSVKRVLNSVKQFKTVINPVIRPCKTVKRLITVYNRPGTHNTAVFYYP